MRPISKIIIHCSATQEGKIVSADTIAGWHLQKGYNEIGYHYIIALDGSITKGRPLSQIGAHCLGQNAHSIGICYVGGCSKDMKPKDTRTVAQKKALAGLVAELKKKYPTATVHGHNEFANKACPCFDVSKEFK